MLTANLLLLLIYQAFSAEQEYILNSSKCKIPKIDLFTDQVREMSLPQPYLSCNQSELLTFVEKNGPESATLHIKHEIKSQYGSNVKCCYSYVTRHGSREKPDVGIHISNCQPLSSSVVLTHDIVKVQCYDYRRRTHELVYENVHNPIVVKGPVTQKLTNSDSSKPFSVLFIVIDSVSRLNFMRTMNQTYNFLRDNDFIEMVGYNKVDDNTFPNFAAFLTGFNLDTVTQKCNPKIVGALDSCPMIWYNYRNEGYITAYAEDHSPITTFTFQKKGFSNPPTDYYFKPYIEASETLNIGYHNGMPYCTGPETAGERILNLAKDFATTFKGKPTFGIFWMNSFSHDALNAPYGMDEKVKNFFNDLKNEGVLDESVVILLSDHGLRYGRIRTTTSGWFEERLPLHMISLPAIFRNEFPAEYRNVLENSKKLTSTYDLFCTLEDILVLSGKKYERGEASPYATCTSLFRSLPRDRSCSDTGIDERWCTCIGHFRSIDEYHPFVKIATDSAMRKIDIVSAWDLKCVNLTLGKILTANVSESTPNNEQYLFVAFQTNPPTSTYIVTVIFSQVVTPESKMYVTRIDNRSLRDSVLNFNETYRSKLFQKWVTHKCGKIN